MSNTLDSSRPEHDSPSEDASSDDLPLSAEIHVGEIAAGETPLCNRLIHVDIIVDDSTQNPATTESIAQAIRASAAHRGFTTGEIGVRVTDDGTIRDLNQKHLGHDYPTDVISFPYSADGDHLAGELVASADTAVRLTSAQMPGWSASAELLLYVVHGTLHITGMDDQQEDDRAAMRRAEESIMIALGFTNVRSFGADQAIGADRVCGDDLPSSPMASLPRTAAPENKGDIGL